MSERIEIRDPIHGAIPIDPWAKSLIDHPWLQRLRRVKQLGMANLVYPGANHTRFEHSLGAHHLSTQFAKALGLAEEDQRTLRAAALLHDVGHGPFSHAYERVTGLRHELRTVDLIRWGPLHDLLRKSEIHPPDVSDAVLGQGKLSTIVSGSLDTDRMDYLLRDAHYTGVRATIDVDRLFTSAKLHPQHGLVLRESGVTAAEGLLTTRFLLYPSVYLHHAVRSAEGMLVRAMRLAAQAESFDPVRAQEWDDEGMLAHLRAEGGIPKQLVEDVLQRRLYKRVQAVGRPTKVPDIERAQEDLSSQIAQAAKVPEHAVLVEVPKLPGHRDQNLLVERRDGTLQPLPERSALCRSLQEATKQHIVGYVYAHPKHQDAVHAVTPRILADAGWVGQSGSLEGQS